MSFLKATAIGGFTVLVIEIALAFLLNAVGVAQHWNSGRIGVGPLDIYTINRSGGSFSVGTGVGLLVVAIAFGLLNGVAAQWLNRSPSR
jgi:hypothetical protein